jgi:hypothetical protein
MNEVSGCLSKTKQIQRFWLRQNDGVKQRFWLRQNDGVKQTTADSFGYAQDRLFDSVAHNETVSG